MQGGVGEGRLEAYARAFDRFFARPRMSSTYKPVFVGALVDVGRWEEDDRLEGRRWIRRESDGRISVGLDFVAVRFAKFYWDMAAGFGARHAPERMADADDPSRDVLNIVKVISEEIEKRERAEVRRAAMSAGSDPRDIAEAASDAARRARAGAGGAGGPPTLAELASDEMAAFRQRVVARAIKPEVLRHLQEGMPELYERDGDRIVLDADAVRYRGMAGAALKAGLSHMIAVLLEEVNPSMRHAASKARQDVPYEERLKKVVRLEARAMEQRADVESLYRISSDLTAGLERLAALKT